MSTTKMIRTMLDHIPLHSGANSMLILGKQKAKSIAQDGNWVDFHSSDWRLESGEGNQACGTRKKRKGFNSTAP
jgi:hypothetical protein